MSSLSHVQKARIATSLIFAINGILSANWISRIPSIKERLHATTGQLGVSLFGMPVGLIVGAVLASWLVQQFGDRQVVRGSAILYCLFLPLLGLSPNTFFLFFVFVCMGISAGVLDVSMNIQATAIEHAHKKPIMSSFHGLFSAGGLLGALMGGFIATLGINVTVHLLSVGFVLVIVTLAVYYWFLHVARIDEPGPLFVGPNAALLALGVIAFCALMGEGAIGDWSGVYLKESLGTTIGFSALGYGAFSLLMALGRFAGDSLTAQFGRTKVTRYGGVLGLLGMLCVVLGAQPVLALVGFGAVGLGFAAIFPNVVSSASRNTTMSHHTAIAGVTTMGYLGFLLGPPLIGISADVLTLRYSLGIIAILSLIIVMLAKAVR